MYLKAKYKLRKDKITLKFILGVNIMEESLIKRVKNFPPLDETVLKIQRIASDHNASIRELVTVVEKDPMLTANILKATNSPLYGRQPMVLKLPMRRSKPSTTRTPSTIPMQQENSFFLTKPKHRRPKT